MRDRTNSRGHHIRRPRCPGAVAFVWGASSSVLMMLVACSSEGTSDATQDTSSATVDTSVADSTAAAGGAMAAVGSTSADGTTAAVASGGAPGSSDVSGAVVASTGGSLAAAGASTTTVVDSLQGGGPGIGGATTGGATAGEVILGQGGVASGGAPSLGEGGMDSQGGAGGLGQGGGNQAAAGATTAGLGGDSSGGAGGSAAEDGWVDLFNGVDLEGWVAHDGGRGDNTSLPIADVFQVEAGEIHVYSGASDGSPQVFGNLRSETSLSGNYVLHVEYKWGQNKFAPRAANDRDAGILFHITGSDVTKVFPDSLEMQIGDSQVGGDYMTGDLWILGTGTRADVMENGQLVTLGGAGSVPHYASVHAENARGEWNECEITVDGASSAIYMLNGVEVHRVYNFKYNGQPLSEGFVSVQAEWAEIYYRNIRYRQISP